MPDLFGSVIIYVLSGLVVACAQLIYATVGFGAGMFAIALLAMLLPDLAGAVATLYLLTFVTEIWVLCWAWREAKVKLLLGLLPTAAIGMWLGTGLLAAGEVAVLKRALGVLVVAAGMWFLHEERGRRTGNDPNDPSHVAGQRKIDHRTWLSLPAGLAAGTLAGLFGTGGPPVIVLLKSYRLGKGAFRATLLWFFLLVSILRGISYLQAGLLTTSELTAALWLLPASLIGMLAGMAAHRRIAERHFATAVSVLLVLLGVLLAISGGR